MVQPLGSAVAVITYVTITLSFGPTMLLPSQLPATSASLMPLRCGWTAGAGAGGGFWAPAAVAPAAKATAERGRIRRIRGSSDEKGLLPVDRRAGVTRALVHRG